MQWMMVALVILVFTYLFCQRQRLSWQDKGLVGISALMLAATTWYQQRTRAWEGFVDDLGTYQPVKMEENYGAVVPKMKVYLTMFHKDSFPQTGNKWLNVAYDPKRPECKSVINPHFTFENPPIFSVRGGVAFGSNRLYGPYSNELGISLQSTFTIFLCVRHGDFVEGNPKEVELLKLYANSGNNNGLALYIKADTVRVEDNVQKGQLMFKFVDDEEATPCLLNANDTAFTFDRLNPCFFFIIKEVDKIRIAYMIGGSNVIKTLAVVNTRETTATFSNKEMVINRFQNWKGTMYALGIMDEAIPDNEITSIYNHVYSEYLKVTNDDYVGLVSNYNSILDALKKFSQCPYDSTVCKSCDTITKWNDVSQLIQAPSACKAAITTYCKANPKHPLCKCWEPTSADYKTQSCVMYRQIFDPNSSLADGIKQEDLDKIKAKYNLINADECAKPSQDKSKACTTEDTLLKNQYMDYELDKLQIRGNVVGKTVNPYKTQKVYELDAKVQDVGPAPLPSKGLVDPKAYQVSKEKVQNPYQLPEPLQKLVEPEKPKEKSVQKPSPEIDDPKKELRNLYVQNTAATGLPKQKEVLAEEKRSPMLDRLMTMFLPQ